MGCQATPEVRTQHGGDHRAVAAARLAHNTTVLPLWQRTIVSIDPGHDLIAQVAMIAAGSGRIHKLAPTVRGPTIHPDHNTRRHIVAHEELINQFWKCLAKR